MKSVQSFYIAHRFLRAESGRRVQTENTQEQYTRYHMRILKSWTFTVHKEIRAREIPQDEDFHFGQYVDSKNPDNIEQKQYINIILPPPDLTYIVAIRGYQQ